MNATEDDLSGWDHATSDHSVVDASKPAIYVTKSFVPPIEEFTVQLQKIWKSHVLTNNGPIHRELEEILRARFDVPHLSLFANGTLALQLALRALGVKGKVITTPYSYVATTSAILWERCEPVYVDIRPDTLCIDPELIEAAITPDTTAILATHVYGIPCDVESIEAIAKKHGLKVIYDAAHAFDVQFKQRSILSWGDASILSFHATKLFHTVEGGAVILTDTSFERDLRLMRSFGHYGDDHYMLGMNAKMSELHAAMGLSLLPYLDQIREQRKAITEQYDEAFVGSDINRPVLPEALRYNYSYYPVMLKDHATREQVLTRMMEKGVNTRRYFFPSLNELPYVPYVAMPVSENMARRMLCLPLYPGLSEEDVDRVIDSFNASLR